MRLSQLRQAVAFDHTGSMMIAAVVPDDTVARLKQLKIVDPNSETALEDKLHVTLLYLGKGHENKSDAIIEAVRKVAAGFPPLTAQVGGFGHFNRGDDGIPCFACIDCKGLNRLQAKIEEAVEPIVPSQSEHGFAPHMTTGYVTEESGVKVPSLTEDVAFPIDAVWFCVGNDYQKIPLAG